MHVHAGFVDSSSNTTIAIDLQLVQDRPPLLVWGDGRSPAFKPEAANDLERYNYYYSLTDLAATGTVRIGDERFEVSGLT